MHILQVLVLVSQKIFGAILGNDSMSRLWDGPHDRKICNPAYRIDQFLITAIQKIIKKCQNFVVSKLRGTPQNSNTSTCNRITFQVNSYVYLLTG